MKSQEEEFPIKFMCEIFGVSDSGYYAWRKRDNSQRESEELSLVRKIEEIHQGSGGSYGSPRILRVLKGMGESCNKTKVERLMKKNGIRAKAKRKFRVTTDSKHNLPVAPNILERNFSSEKPNQVWASDISVPQQVVQEMRVGPRSRFTGTGCKSPQAAWVKIPSRERCGKGAKKASDENQGGERQ